MLELQLELRLGTHAVMDMTTFVFVAHNHDASDGMKALFATLDGPLPKTEQDELYGRTGNNQYPGISEFMNDKTQGMTRMRTRKRLTARLIRTSLKRLCSIV